MKENAKFYVCKHCGNLIEKINDSGVPVICCGEKMELLNANSVDAAVEKHVPVYEKKEEEIIVKVGSVAHPMQEEHYIMWITMVSDDKVERIYLKPEDKAEAKFPYIPYSTIYAYCNLHGLWKVEVK